MARLSQTFSWKTWRDVKRYVASCPTCQYQKVNITVKRTLPLQITPQHSPFEIVGMDHLGSFKSSPRGNRYIIVAVDLLNKWLEVEAVPDASASYVTRFVRRHLVLRHGVPEEIISD